MLLVVEQFLNGLQFGLLLFLLAAGLTLVFGIMDLVNLAHGSLYMMGAYFAATFVAWTGNFVLGIVLALGATLLLGIVLEFVALRHLYGRDHLDHVLATFGLILFFNDAVRLIWGPAGLALPLPPWLTVPVQIVPGVYYPAYRLAIIVVALAVALMLYLVVMRTRIGMLIRAGASNREMIGALGINIKLLYTLVFGLGAALAGLAGMMQAPILTVQIGMGENILILAFVIIVIGGIGSIRGAFLAAIFVGLIDTLGRAFLPDLLRKILSSAAAVDRGARAVLDADLSVDGDRAGGAAGGAVSGQPSDERLPFNVRNAVAALMVAGLLLLPLYSHAQRQRLRADAVHPHRDLRAGGGQPQPDHGLWRDDEFRPRRLSRHRRLRRRHPGAGGHRLRIHPVAGGAGWPRRVLRAGDRRAVAAHPRRLFHHDHAGVRADGLLRRLGACPLRRRRRADHLQAQRFRRPDQSVEPRAVLLSLPRLPVRRDLS